MRDVVADGVSEDVVEGFGFWDVGAWLSYHGHEFAFVVETCAFLCYGVDGDGVGGTGEGGYWFVLEEYEHPWVTRHEGPEGLQIRRGILGSACWTTDGLAPFNSFYVRLAPPWHAARS